MAQGSGRRWALDLDIDKPVGRILTKAPMPVTDPPGYGSRASDDDDTADGKQGNGPNINLKKKKAWELATSPFKQVMMNSFMLWMSGNQINIFSIPILIMTLRAPITAILGVKNTFAPFASDNLELSVHYFAYVAINLLGLAVAVYKCSNLGLLPTSPGDWIGYVQLERLASTSTGRVLNAFNLQ